MRTSLGPVYAGDDVVHCGVGRDIMQQLQHFQHISALTRHLVSLEAALPQLTADCSLADQLEQVCQLTQLTSLKLQLDIRPSEVAQTVPAAIGQLQHLETLHLSLTDSCWQYSCSVIFPFELSALQRLTAVTINNIHAACREIWRNAQLTSFRAHSCKLMLEQLPAHRNCLTSMRNVRLQSCSISGSLCCLLAYLQLQELELDGVEAAAAGGSNNHGHATLGSQVLATVSQLTSLRTLTISDMSLDGSALNLQHLCKLKFLTLDGLLWSTSSPFIHVNTCRSLHAEYLRNSGYPSISFSASPDWENLRVLNLDGNFLTIMPPTITCLMGLRCLSVCEQKADFQVPQVIDLDCLPYLHIIDVMQVTEHAWTEESADVLSCMQAELATKFSLSFVCWG